VRGVAVLVLLGDAFRALPAAFQEGQRIVNGMQDVMRLLLTCTVYETLLIIGAAMVGAAFPITPKHNSLLGLLTVGLPPLALAIWARPGAPPRRVLHSVIHFMSRRIGSGSCVLLNPAALRLCPLLRMERGDVQRPHPIGPFLK
jgi:cation-transporting P-type ATPase E